MQKGFVSCTGLSSTLPASKLLCQDLTPSVSSVSGDKAQPLKLLGTDSLVHVGLSMDRESVDDKALALGNGRMWLAQSRRDAALGRGQRGGSIGGCRLIPVGRDERAEKREDSVLRPALGGLTQAS